VARTLGRNSDTTPTAQESFAQAAAIGLAATALGLARFGYAVLLPAMRTDLRWSYTQAGGMNTANALGYLAGALAATITTAVIGERRTFALSFTLTATSILASGFTTSYVLLLLLRGLGGAAGAVLFISGGALAARVANASRSPGLILGVYFAGVGPGILISALLAPIVFDTAHGWRMGWLIMGAVATVSGVVATRASRLIRETPNHGRPAPLQRLAWAVAAFALFGLGYISYMTFIVAYYRETGRTVSEIVLFWSLLGLASTASAWFWRSLLDRANGGTALAALLAMVTAGAALPLASQSAAAMFGSAILFGAAFLSVSAAITQLIRQNLAPHQYAVGLAVALSLFALGQVIGPVMTGVLADWSGSLKAGLAASTVFLGIAALVATRQPRAGAWIR
jgi:predicted MFS family arabinose efflux permease